MWDGGSASAMLASGFMPPHLRTINQAAGEIGGGGWPCMWPGWIRCSIVASDKGRL